ncbi:MAG TPA: response regulator, partial [Saprospiraceae bacterium]|nr:response regulator [Saprospiraceae bacterium]
MTPTAPIIKAIIADDESLARNVIRKYLVGYSDIEVVAEAADGLTALNLIQEHRPGLVFLDIQMPELDGLSMLNELDMMPMILFTTAYHQYAIQAFDHHAVDYLLKPFDKKRFDLAISRVMERSGQTSALQVQLKAMQNTLDQLIDGGKKYLNRILVKGKEGHVFVETRDILRFEAYSDYVKIHTRERFFLKNISMMELES